MLVVVSGALSELSDHVLIYVVDTKEGWAMHLEPHTMAFLLTSNHSARVLQRIAIVDLYEFTVVHDPLETCLVICDRPFFCPASIRPRTRIASFGSRTLDGVGYSPNREIAGKVRETLCQFGRRRLGHVPSSNGNGVCREQDLY